MSPPTEQLIRDYLNRLSVAARGRLSPEERRTLVERTRQLIEQKADFAGRPTTLEVGRVLARLGDPVALVEQEARRLGGVRGEPEHQPADGGFLTRVLRREPAWVRGAGWRGSAELRTGADGEAAGLEEDALGAEAADRTVLEGTVLDATVLDGGAVAPAAASAAEPGDEPVRPQWPSVVARDAGPGNGRQPHARSPRSADHSDTAARVTLNGEPIASGAAVNGSVAGHGDPAGGGTGGSNTTADDTGGGGDGGIDSAWQLDRPVRSALGSRLRRLLAGLYVWFRKRPVETLALGLLGLGGVIYPPVFLLGAAMALVSRLWDYRDKWIGLALPLVLTVIGLAFGIAVGGRSHGLHEGWVWLNISSRVAAVVAAGYLAWRAGHGRRAPATPPWNKPHKLR